MRLLNAKVTILGEVQRPGTFSFTENNISLLAGPGSAGDLTINGSREDVMVLRYIDGRANHSAYKPYLCQVFRRALPNGKTQ